MKRSSLSILAACLLLFAAHRALAESHDCVPTGSDDDAEGKAVSAIKDSGGSPRGRLKLRARNVHAGTAFNVSVNGVRIGSLTSGTNGRGRVRFSSAPRGADQYLGVDPRGSRVVVSEPEGEDVLECDVPDNDGETTTPRCCLPHEGEHECEHMSVESCLAENGTPLDAGSCFPDPCDEGEPSEDVRCCFSGDVGSQCLVLEAEHCSAEHGTSLGAGVCEPNPCEPPAGDAVRCCIEHEGEQSCLHLSAAHCLDEGGTDLGEGSCDPDPCGGPPPEPIRCCFEHEDASACLLLTPELCGHEGGENLGAGSCEPNPCPQPPPPTRCCLTVEGHGVCEHMSADHCADEGGSDVGAGSCEPNPCG
jgi:hypothetical protein